MLNNEKDQTDAYTACNRGSSTRNYMDYTPSKPDSKCISKWSPTQKKVMEVIWYWNREGRSFAETQKLTNCPWKREKDVPTHFVEDAYAALSRGIIPKD
jgi:hypothetical protein